MFKLVIDNGASDFDREAWAVSRDDLKDLAFAKLVDAELPGQTLQDIDLSDEELGDDLLI